MILRNAPLDPYKFVLHGDHAPQLWIDRRYDHLTAARNCFQRFTVLVVRLICYGPMDDPIAAPYNEDVFPKSTGQCHRQHPTLPLSTMIYNYHPEVDLFHLPTVGTLLGQD